MEGSGDADKREAVGSSMSAREFMKQFLAYKESSDTIEPSTACGYLAEAEVEGLTSIHYDIVSLLVVGSEKALLRHHKNVLNDRR